MAFAAAVVECVMRSLIANENIKFVQGLRAGLRDDEVTETFPLT